MAETEADLLEQAFTLIAEQGWRDFSLTALAKRAGVPLSKVYAAFPTRAAVLPALGRRLDEAMLDLDPAEEFAGMSPRERVFELVMRRLDAMAPFRAGLRALGRRAATSTSWRPPAATSAARRVGSSTPRRPRSARCAGPPPAPCSASSTPASSRSGCATTRPTAPRRWPSSTGA
jgi:AcrR family transcriptional regulator